MAYAFYASMGFLDTVASSADEYVSISVRLGLDPAFRRRCGYIISQLSHVMWERAEVVLEWELALMTSVGYDARARVNTRALLRAAHESDKAHLEEEHKRVAIGLEALALDTSFWPVWVQPPPGILRERMYALILSIVVLY